MSGKKDGVSLSFLLLCLVIIAGAGYLLMSAFKGKGGPVKVTSATTEGSISLTLTEDKATELLRDAVPDNIPVTDLVVRFTNGHIIISGNADVNGILSSAVTESYPDLGAIKALLPDTVSFSASFTVTVGDNGVDAEPTEFYLSGYRIPIGFLPSALKKSLNSAINSWIGNTGLTITGITVGEGKATISAE
jgi:hypothetical protein